MVPGRADDDASDGSRGDADFRLREECTYVSGQQASCLFEVGTGGVYREVLLLDEVDGEDGLVPG